MRSTRSVRSTSTSTSVQSSAPAAGSTPFSASGGSATTSTSRSEGSASTQSGNPRRAASGSDPTASRARYSSCSKRTTSASVRDPAMTSDNPAAGVPDRVRSVSSTLRPVRARASASAAARTPGTPALREADDSATRTCPSVAWRATAASSGPTSSCWRPTRTSMLPPAARTCLAPRTTRSEASMASATAVASSAAATPTAAPTMARGGRIDGASSATMPPSRTMPTAVATTTRRRADSTCRASASQSGSRAVEGEGSVDVSIGARLPTTLLEPREPPPADRSGHTRGDHDSRSDGLSACCSSRSAVATSEAAVRASAIAGQVSPSRDVPGARVSPSSVVP